MWMWHTLSERQQQQRWQSSDDGRQQQHTTPTKAIDGQADEDAGESSGHHSEEVGEVEVGGVTVQVPGETVLDSCSNEAVREMREWHHHFYQSQYCKLSALKNDPRPRWFNKPGNWSPTGNYKLTVWSWGWGSSSRWRESVAAPGPNNTWVDSLLRTLSPALQTGREDKKKVSSLLGEMTESQGWTLKIRQHMMSHLWLETNASEVSFKAVHRCMLPQIHMLNLQLQPQRG